jgi:hypothetical protein
MTARYNRGTEAWEFVCDGITFQLSGIPFNEAAFGWARQSVELVRALEKEMCARVAEAYRDENRPCDETKLSILAVVLDDYPQSPSTLEVFVYQEGGQYLQANVIITDGKIVKVYGLD